MTVVVREAVPAEYAAIGELTVDAYSVFPGAADYPDYLADLRDVATRARSCPVYVALDGATGRVVGGATYVPGPRAPLAELEREGEAGIRMLAVAPQAQGQGAGTALVEALLARARADGRQGMALHTLPAMTTAHRIYERFGFRHDPTRDWQAEPDLLLLAYSVDFTELDRAKAANAANASGDA